jgi:hypothetical protein
MEIELEHIHQQNNDKQKPHLSSLLLPIKFQTAFKEFSNKHTFLTSGIEKIDSVLKITTGHRLSIVGKRKYTQILITRLCISALSKKGHKIGFDTSNVIFVDAGNNTDIYQCVNFARQCGVDIEQILRHIIISRVFTIYQLTNMIIHELSNVIQKFDSKIIVISDLLNMFIHDPQIEIKEAKYLICGIINSITTTRALKDVLFIVSLAYEDGLYQNKSATPYDHKIILSRFDKCIEIVANNNDNALIDIRIRNSWHKNNINDLSNSNFFSITERDLLTVSCSLR